MAREGIKSVNINKYQGDWYEIASFPNWFQRNCSNSKANYELSDGKVLVTNTCVKSSGKTSSIRGDAYPANKRNSVLKVGFPPLKFIRSDYVVEYLDPDYQYVIVGSQDRKYLWFLGRKPYANKKQYNLMLKIAKRKGYDVSNLRKTRRKIK